MTRESGDELLDLTFTYLVERLTGIDVDYDFKVIDLFSKVTKIPHRQILAKMRTHCHPGPLTRN